MKLSDLEFLVEQNVTPRPTAAPDASRNFAGDDTDVTSVRRRQSIWDRAYAQTHNADGTQKAGTQTATQKAEAIQLVSPDTPPPQIQISLADIYTMTGRPIPRVKGPGDRMIVPEHIFTTANYTIGTGEGQISPELASAHARWVEGGRMPGAFYDSATGETKPWHSNSYLVDLGLAAAAGGIESAQAVGGGIAAAIDGAMNKIGVYDGKPLSFQSIGNTYIVDGKTLQEKPTMERIKDWIESHQSAEFKNEVELTSTAVNSWADAASLAMGQSNASWLGAFGIMMNELPMEIVNVGLMYTTSWWSGGAINLALNTSEAAGAAMNEISQQINMAYDKGTLQKQWQWSVAQEMATQQLIQDGKDPSDPTFNAQVQEMALEQVKTNVFNHGLLQVAAAGGVIDSIADMVLYRGPISKNIFDNVIGKTILNPVVEGASEGIEKTLQNMAIMDSAGKITTKWDGSLNAAYNGMIAGNTGTAVSALANTPARTRQAYALMNKWFAGGKDPKLLVDIASVDPSVLMEYIGNPDGSLRIAETIKSRTIVPSDLEGKRPNRRGEYTVTKNGQTFKVTMKEARENEKSLEMVKVLQKVTVDSSENIAVLTFDSEDDARNAALVLGMDKKDSKDINKVFSFLENVRRLDARITGRSDLEPPTWNDLNERQRVEYLTTGKITFVNDEKRGNQTWTRQQVLYNTRRNNEDVPAEIANLADNSDPRPTLGTFEGRDRLQRARDQIVLQTQQAGLALEQDQQIWDEEFGETHNPDGSPKDPNAEGIAGRQLTADDIPESGGARPTADMEYYANDIKTRLQGNVWYQNAIKARDEELAELEKLQTQWDNDFGKTNNPLTGQARLKPLDDFQYDEQLARTRNNDNIDKIKVMGGTPPVTGSGRGDGQAELDQRKKDAEAERIANLPDVSVDTTDDPDADLTTGWTPPAKKEPEVQTTAPEQPRTPPGGSDNLSRNYLIANTKMRLAQGDMDPLAVNAMMKKMEETYPGITQEVFGEKGIESYRQNPAAVQEKLQKEITSPELEQTPTVDTTNLSPEVQTVIQGLQTGDIVTYTTKDGQQKSAEYLGTLDNGNIQLAWRGKNNNQRAVFAMKPEQIVSSVKPDDPPKINTAPPATVTVDTNSPVLTPPETGDTTSGVPDNTRNDPDIRTGPPALPGDVQTPKVQTTSPELTSPETGDTSSDTVDQTKTDTDPDIKTGPTPLKLDTPTADTGIKLTDPGDVQTPKVQTTSPELKLSPDNTGDAEETPNDGERAQKIDKITAPRTTPSNLADPTGITPDELPNVDDDAELRKSELFKRAQAKIDAQNQASDNQLIKKAQDKAQADAQADIDAQNQASDNQLIKKAQDQTVKAEPETDTKIKDPAVKNVDDTSVADIATVTAMTPTVKTDTTKKADTKVTAKPDTKNDTKKKARPGIPLATQIAKNNMMFKPIQVTDPMQLSRWQSNLGDRGVGVMPQFTK